MADAVELAPSDAPELVSLYEDYAWWEDRDESRVAAAIEGSDLALGLREQDGDADCAAGDGGRDGRLVAAARVLTDGAFYASAYDVIVAADRRGSGLGRELMREVVDHDALADAPRVSVACRDGLTDFYEACGFEHARDTVEHGGREEALVHMTYHR